MKQKKLLSFVLVAAMAISLLPTFTLTASADETPTQTTTTEKNITLGTAALSGYDSTNGYDYIYYGAYNDVDHGLFDVPIKWRVLSMDGNDGTYKDGDGNTVAFANAMFLLSEYALKQMAYDADAEKNDDSQKYVNSWRYSDVWKWCNDTIDNASFISSSFTDSEKAYLLKTSKGTRQDEIYTDQLKDDTFFSLSIDEAFQLNDQLNDWVAKIISDPSGNAVRWWLRSPARDDLVYCVDEDDLITSNSVDIPGSAARPAFNLNSGAVLFTSAAKGGKASAAAGDGGELPKNTSFDSFTDNDGYKLTMKREYAEDETEFCATQTVTSTKKGETLAFEYDHAKTGTNEYISAMIVDKTDDEVLYYGQLAHVTEENEASGTVTLKIPTDLACGGEYTIALFNEQINGDDKTDFSSNFVTVDLTAKLAGEGTAAKPYLIYEIFDLEDIRNTVNSGTNCEGKYFRLMNDIDLSTKYGEGKLSWTPIGKGSERGMEPLFNGIFDGNKFEIRNLYINTQTANNLGLFGCIGSSAVIKNLGVTGSVTAKNTSCVGSLAGVGSGTISDCYTHCTVSTDGFASSIGGVVGYIGGSGSITNCYHIGTVNGTLNVGGIAGAALNSSKITSCYYLADAAAVGIGLAEESVTGSAEAKTAEQFASGEVAYALQHGADETEADTPVVDIPTIDIPTIDIPTIDIPTIDIPTDGIIETPIIDNPKKDLSIKFDPQIWGQKIGTDKYPTFQYETIHEDEYNGAKVYRNAIDGNKILLLGADKKSATAVLNEAGTYTIVFVDYEDNRLVNVEALEVEVDKAQAVRVVSNKAFTLGTGDKIMLWNNFETIAPMCEVYKAE